MVDNYQKKKLANGLRIITVPLNNVQSVTVLFLVGAGSRYEKKQVCGLSHFLEHMAFKGTKKRPNALAISSEIEGIGGEFNAFTAKDHTGFYIKAAIKHLPVAIDVLSDMLLNSKFEEEEIEKERGVIIEEINLYEDTPARKISEVYEELLYKDTPLGWDIAGQKESIKNIKRSDFLEYIRNLYSPENTVTIIAGGISNSSFINQEKIFDLLGKYLDNWQNKKTWQYEKASDKQEKPACKVVYKKTEQAHLAVGVRGYNLFHPDRYALLVLSTILGGGMSSRLFIQVRERRGLAYYINSQVEFYTDVGHFVTLAGVDLKRIDEAIEVILNEFRLKNLNEKELNKAKEFLKGRLILELEDSKIMAMIFGISELLEERIRTPAEILKEIEKVTPFDIERLAKEIFKPEKLNLAVIGPFRDGQRFEKILKL